MSEGVGDQFDVVHLTSAHPVGDTRIFVKEAQSLAAAGYRVAVLGPDAAAGRRVDNSGVVQITLPRPQGRVARFARFGRQLLQATLALRPRVVHLHDPDLLSLRRRLQAAGVRVIYDMHEDFPKAMLSRHWLGPMVVRHAVAGVVDRMESRALQCVDGIVLADRQLASRLPVQAAPHVIVRNFIHTAEWPDVTPAACHDPLRCIYVGDITEARGALRMCDAIAACRDAGVAATLDLVGPCRSDLQAKIRTHGAADHVVLHGRLDRPAVVTLMAQSDIGFGLFEPTPAYREGLPVKLFEYMISGLPVVATNLPRMGGETALTPGMALVEWDAPAGELAAAVVAARSICVETRKQMQDQVRQHYNWAAEAQALQALYQRLLPL